MTPEFTLLPVISAILRDLLSQQLQLAFSENPIDEFLAGNSFSLESHIETCSVEKIKSLRRAYLLWIAMLPHDRFRILQTFQCLYIERFRNGTQKECMLGFCVFFIIHLAPVISTALNSSDNVISLPKD